MVLFCNFVFVKIFDYTYNKDYSLSIVSDLNQILLYFILLFCKWGEENDLQAGLQTTENKSNLNIFFKKFIKTYV